MRTRSRATPRFATVAACKTVVAELLKDPEERDTGLCDRVVDACFASEDYKEGRAAFMEKRISLSYHLVPGEALEDPLTLAEWARPAFDAALRARGGRRR